MHKLIVLTIVTASTVMFVLSCLSLAGYVPLSHFHKPFWLELAAIIGLLLIGLVLVAYTLHVLHRTRKIGAAVLGLYVVSMYAAITIMSFADAYRFYGLKPTVDTAEKPTTTDAIYFSIVTWTTVGYGDFVPTPDSRLIAATEAIFGYIYMAVYIGYVLSVMSFVSEAETRKNAPAPSADLNGNCRRIG